MFLLKKMLGISRMLVISNRQGTLGDLQGNEAAILPAHYTRSRWPDHRDIAVTSSARHRTAIHVHGVGLRPLINQNKRGAFPNRCGIDRTATAVCFC